MYVHTYIRTYLNIVRCLDINQNSSAISALNAQNIYLRMLDYLCVMKLCACVKEF